MTKKWKCPKCNQWAYEYPECEHCKNINSKYAQAEIEKRIQEIEKLIYPYPDHKEFTAFDHFLDEIKSLKLEIETLKKQVEKLTLEITILKILCK